MARVNSQIITRSEFLRSKDQLKDDVKQQDPNNADKLFSEREKDILRDLIDQQLLLEKGKDLGITGDTDLIKRLDQMRKDMKLDTMEELEKAATAQGISYEDFKQNMRNQIITQKVIGEEVGSHLSITTEEQQKFYDEHKSEMEQPESIRLSEILIAPQKPADKPLPSNCTAATMQTIKQLTMLPNRPRRLQLWLPRKPKPMMCSNKSAPERSFEDIAKKNSAGPSAAQGGDLGVFKRGTLAKELEDRTFAMKAGEVTDVIRTKQGYVILKVTDHQMAGIPSLERCRAQDPGRSLLREAAARAPRLSDQAARRGLHRYQRGIYGFRRQPESNQADRDHRGQRDRSQESEEEEKEGARHPRSLILESADAVNAAKSTAALSRQARKCRSSATSSPLVYTHGENEGFLHQRVCPPRKQDHHFQLRRGLQANQAQENR